MSYRTAMRDKATNDDGPHPQPNAVTVFTRIVEVPEYPKAVPRRIVGKRPIHDDLPSSKRQRRLLANEADKAQAVRPPSPTNIDRALPPTAEDMRSTEDSPKSRPGCSTKKDKSSTTASSQEENSSTTVFSQEAADAFADMLRLFHLFRNNDWYPVHWVYGCLQPATKDFIQATQEPKD